MRIALFCTAALVAIAGVTAPAAAQYPGSQYPGSQFPRAQYPYAPDRSYEEGARRIEWRLDMIYERIETGRRTGQISHDEAGQLHNTGQAIYDRYRDYRRDGIDRREYQELSQRIGDLRQRLQWRYRGPGRGGEWGRDGDWNRGSEQGRYGDDAQGNDEWNRDDDWRRGDERDDRGRYEDPRAADDSDRYDERRDNDVQGEDWDTQSDRDWNDDDNWQDDDPWTISDEDNRHWDERAQQNNGWIEAPDGEE